MNDTRYLDTHDRCLTAVSEAVAPFKVTPDGDNAVLATYYCPRCRERWTCGWSVQEEAA
jgi:hypothetical protein